MFTQDNKEIASKSVTGEGCPAPLSRRALIKGGAAAMPLILTLQSGAALARSSNLIGATSYDATDALGRTLCLDTSSVYPVGGDTAKYDLGEPPYARVTAISDREYHTEPNSGHTDISAAQMCESSQIGFYYKDRGWQQAQVPQGILVSAAALSSFAGSIYITDL